MIHVPTDFTPKETFSASGLAMGLACEMKWGLTYLAGWREVEVPWAPGVFGASLGTVVHRKMEDYYGGSQVDWTDYPGRRAFALLEHAPRLDEVVWTKIESSVAIDTQRVRASTDPIVFTGKRDMVARLTPAGRTRLGIPGDPAIPVLFDWKTTADWKWLKTAPELCENEQGILYPLSVVQEFGFDYAPSRWVYTHTKSDVPRAIPVDFGPGRVVLEQRADALIVRAIGLRQYMREGRDPHTLPYNLSHCSEFGGCKLHASRGGPCRARTPEPQSKPVEIPPMSIADRIKANMSPVTEAAPAETPAAEPTPAPAVAEAAPAPKTRAAKPKASAGGRGALALAFAEAESEAEAANAKLEAAKDALVKALG